MFSSKQIIAFLIEKNKEEILTLQYDSVFL